jgi:exodeoxyribonuclease III
MQVRLASWNVNSVRLRAEQVARFIHEAAPDLLCLQEIKCREGEFPTAAFVDAGLPHLKIAGQKGSHGVAIASRLPIEDAPKLDLCREGHARAVSVKVAGIEVHNFYIPAGGDIADRALNPKFDHKLNFYERLTAEMAKRDPADPLAILGDLNVAPGENDVWNHRYMSRVVSHTPVELEAMAALKASLGFIDLAREMIPEPLKLASWWSYRAIDFRKSNRGLRLDHIWVTPGLRDAAFRKGSAACRIHDNVRAWDPPQRPRPGDGRSGALATARPCEGEVPVRAFRVFRGSRNRPLLAGMAAQAASSSRAAFFTLATARSRFRRERWSRKRMPSRWSISCWMQTAKRPSASSSTGLPS